MTTQGGDPTAASGPDEPLTVVQRIAARPETVFTFFTDGEAYRRWMGLDAELDPRPGGRYRVRIDDRGTVAVGEFVAVEPPSRVVFTFGWEGHDALPPGSTTVEVTLRAEGAATVVTLVHHDLPAPAVDEHRGGWQLYLPRLATAATGGDPGPEPNA